MIALLKGSKEDRGVILDNDIKNAINSALFSMNWDLQMPFDILSYVIF